MADNVERVRNVLYQLYSEQFGLKTIQEPIGYDKDIRGYTRDSDSKGFIVKTAIDLEFYGSGADYLYDLFSAYGLVKCLITKYERDLYSINEEFKVRYIQEVDLGSLKRDSKTGKVTVSATEGGLYADIKNRESDEYDLINKESADGVDIGEIKTKIFSPVPRSLFYKSFLKDNFSNYLIKSANYKDLFSVSESSRTIPLKVVYDSGDGIQTPYNVSNSNDQDTAPTDDQNYRDGTVQNVGNQFYWRTDIARTVDLKLNLEFIVSNNTYRRRLFDNTVKLRVELRRSRRDGIYDILENDRVILLDINPLENIGIKQTVKLNDSIFLNEGDSLSLVFATLATKGESRGTMALNLFLDIPVSELTIEDSADYAPSTSRCMKPLDFFNRIVSKITGKTNLVTSSVFGEGGEYENMVVDNGLWARQFDDTYLDSSDEEQSIQMKTSFKDAFESFSYLEPLCWFTYFDGNVEKIRIEKATYTQKNFIGLDLGSVDDVNTESSKMDFFKTIKLGHSQSMEYEELSGLDEPNGKSEFNTFITRSDSDYDVSSKYRTDAVGYELIRRKPFNKYPKEDTSRDSDIWIHDAKKLASGVYTHNLWNDVGMLDELPKGVFKPENLWNFRLSPMNRLYYGHGYSIKRGLYHFPKKSIRFNSSNANKNLSTTKNSVTLNEGGSILVSDLPKPRVEAEKINFTFKMTQLIEDKLLGYTKVDGELIPNYFGLIKYNEKGEDKYGRLIKLETSDEAKMTIIKARL